MPEEEKLKLGKGAAFVKSLLKGLPQVDETWEADFRALPRPIEQTQTHYLGMVVSSRDGSRLTETTVHGRPSVNDLATILAHAMRRPLDEGARRDWPDVARRLSPPVIRACWTLWEARHSEDEMGRLREVLSAVARDS